MAKQSKKITTPIFRCSFLRVFTPAKDQFGRDVYEVTMLFEPQDYKAHKDKFEEIIEEATELFFGPPGKRPEMLKTPFRKGVQRSHSYPQGFDLTEYPDYEGKMIAPARSYEIQPGIVNAQREDIIDPKEVYSGMYARASIVAYGYDNKGGKGIAFGLQNIQKIKDGEYMGSNRGPAADDFEDYEVPEAEGAGADLLAGI